MRLLLPIVFIFFNLLQNKFKKINFYKISLFLYFCFLTLRFMQGTDYIHYLTCYNIERPLNEVIQYGFVNTQFELLYNLGVSFFKMFELPFPIFISVINFFNLFLINKFIEKFSSNKILSLTLLYLLYGIVFFESAIRQSIAISIVLGINMVAFKDKNVVKLIIGGIFAFLFHRSSICISLVMILYYFICEKNNSEKLKIKLNANYKIIILITIILFLIINILPFDLIFSSIPGPISEKVIIYYNTYSISWPSAVIRIFYLFTIIYLLKKNRINIFDKSNFIYFLYIFGLMLYFMFIKFSILSRITVYFEMLEIVVFVDVFKNFERKINLNNLLFASYCILVIVFFFKDGIETQRQSQYIKVNIVCPYYTYLDKDRALSNIEQYNE